MSVLKKVLYNILYIILYLFNVIVTLTILWCLMTGLLFTDSNITRIILITGITLILASKDLWLTFDYHDKNDSFRIKQSSI